MTDILELALSPEQTAQFGEYLEFRGISECSGSKWMERQAVESRHWPYAFLSTYSALYWGTGCAHG